MLVLREASRAGEGILAKNPGGHKDVWCRAKELMLESCAENDGGAERKGISSARLIISQCVASYLPNCEKARIECINFEKAQYTRVKDGVIFTETMITLQSGEKFRSFRKHDQGSMGKVKGMIKIR